jgi:Iron-containing redox enzyme
LTGLPQRVGSEPSEATSASDRLRRKVELVSGPLGASWARLLAHPRMPELFREYLVTIHCVIRSTVPLMEGTMNRARELADADPVAADVAAYLERHVEEERDHDEWLLDDLELLGMDRGDVLGRVPSATVASLVGAQYYWSLHVHPVALLGYLSFLEGSPPTPDLIEDLVARTGFPREAFRTLAKHGELDPEHGAELEQTIDSLPLTRDQEALLGLSAMWTVNLLGRAIDEIVDHAA